MVQRAQKGPPMEPPTQAFSAKYDEVWRAAHLAMIKYKLRIDNSETGILETEQIKEDEVYNPPFPTVSKRPGFRYKIQLKMLKGTIEGKRSTKVTIVKTLENVKNFVDEAEAVISDGLEEQAILYRIERELIIEQGLQRSQKKSKSSENKKSES